VVLSVWKNHLRDPSLNLTIIQRRNRRLETTSCWASEDSSSCNSNELTLLLFFSSGFLPSFYIFFIQEHDMKNSGKSNLATLITIRGDLNTKNGF